MASTFHHHPPKPSYRPNMPAVPVKGGHGYDALWWLAIPSRGARTQSIDYGVRGFGRLAGALVILSPASIHHFAQS